MLVRKVAFFDSPGGNMVADRFREGVARLLSSPGVFFVDAKLAATQHTFLCMVIYDKEEPKNP